jgi:outer membrane protein OmpA-like peptidoglycan-associated protein
MKKKVLFVALIFTASLTLGQNTINCTALKNGCRILESPPSFFTSDEHTTKIDPWTIRALIDENGANGWCSAEKTSFPVSFVFELSEDFFLEKLVFNNQCQKNYPGVCAREVKIEVSSTGPTSDFKETSVYILKEYAVSEFSLNSVGARWIRMTILSNYGHKDFVELMELQVMGKFVEPVASAATVKGLWDSNFDWVSINSNENGYIYGYIYGCYKWSEGELFSGKIDRKIFKFRYSQKENGKEGWAILTLNKESNRLSGIWGVDNDYSQFGFWDFTKKSDEPKACPNDEAVKEVKPDSNQTSESYPQIKDNRLPFKVQLLDFDTNKFIEGKVLVNSESKVVAERSTYQGTASFQLSPSEKNNLTVKAEVYGYMPVNESMDSISANEPVKSIKMKKLEAGKAVVLDNIGFEKGKFSLLPKSYEDLDKMVQMMNSYPQMEIELGGHTDNQGDPKKNVVLSQNRVKEVKNYLISKGIKASRISGIGYGGSKPIASNVKEETRRLNRRVEFKIIKM